MTTAFCCPSLAERLRSIALAGVIALGGFATPVIAVQASGESSAAAGGGFDVSVGSVAELSGLTAVVAANGERVNLRIEPAHDGDIVAKLTDGTVVDLRIDRLDTVYDPDGVTRWWPVTADGVDGWVSGSYLTDPDGASTEMSGEPVSAPDQFTLDGEGLVDRTAVIAGGGDGINLRAAAGHDAAVIDVLAGGTVVDLRVDREDTVYDPDGVTRWWPVTAAGQEGWVSGLYLADRDAVSTIDEPETSAADDDGVPADSAAQFTLEGSGVTGRTAVVAGGGDGVSLRNAPSADAGTISSLTDGTVVNLQVDMFDTVVDADGVTRWWPVEVNGAAGWISGFYLSDGSDDDGDGDPASADSAGTTFPAGSYAAVRTNVDAGANVRADAAPTSRDVGSLREGDVVQVVEGPATFINSANGWYLVTTGDLTGYVDGDLLVVTDPPAEEESDDDDAAAAQPPAEEPDEPEEPDADADSEPAATGPTGGFITPVDGTVTQSFGCSDLGYYVYDPAFGCAVHDGLDIAAPSYTPIVAADGGTVVFAGLCDCGLGYYVEIDHGNDVHTLYGHMAEQPYVAAGQQVSQGDVIGPVGATGIATGPHVHFMVRVNGAAQDPAGFLP